MLSPRAEPLSRVAVTAGEVWCTAAMPRRRIWVKLMLEDSPKNAELFSSTKVMAMPLVEASSSWGSSRPVAYGSLARVVEPVGGSAAAVAAIALAAARQGLAGTPQGDLFVQGERWPFSTSLRCCSLCST